VNSLRHTFTESLRQAGATSDVMLAEVMQRVEYPGLDLRGTYA
jgi:hypothetical protein